MLGKRSLFLPRRRSGHAMTCFATTIYFADCHRRCHAMHLSTAALERIYDE
jgi:hypothetical protein